jgi:arylformamidase
MPTYPGEPGPEIDYLKRIGDNSSANVSRVSMGSHCGTHIDAPHHFIDGRATVEELPIEALLGPAFVVEHSGEGHITAPDLDRFGIPADARRLLAKTRNGRFADDGEFHDFIAFAQTPARGWWTAA